MFVFFKQKTAYEMRISDWSSDVCSSDLQEARPQLRLPRAELLDVEQFRDDGAARYRFAGNAVMVGIRRDAAQLDALRDEKVDHLRRGADERDATFATRTRHVGASVGNGANGGIEISDRLLAAVRYEIGRANVCT